MKLFMLFALFTLSCGPAPYDSGTCGPATCSQGCCTSTGTCEFGTSYAACGSYGDLCFDCAEVARLSGYATACQSATGTPGGLNKCMLRQP